MTEKMLLIKEIAKNIGLRDDEIALYGDYRAKIKLNVRERLNSASVGKYIDVTAMTPTPLGEGKTTTTIGLAMALNKLGKKTIATIRQPSLGPIFGLKGGGAGGGKSKILPYEDVNLHYTGDTHAVTLAHNLCSAFLDNSIYFGNKLNINLEKILWKRVIDISDRALRKIVLEFGKKDEKIKLESGFDITAASEVMAILSLSKSLMDLRERLDRIVVAFDKNNKPVFSRDLQVGGAMAVVLKDAIMPNLAQTIENTPVIIHSGPFANISHGNNSILADMIATKLADYVVTESGFGADCGFEKFVNIKCRYSGLKPDCVVLVCSIRAIKYHSGEVEFSLETGFSEIFNKENIELVKKGLLNLEKQIENVKIYGVPVVVAINKFDSDSEKEISLLEQKAKEFGADGVVVSEVYQKGSGGARKLAELVISLSQKKSKFDFLYPLELSIKEKIEIIAKRIYGAKGVSYSSMAEEKINLYTSLGWDKLPVCISKTQLSLSGDPNLKGRPKDFILPVEDITPYLGAGYLTVLCSKVYTMPGLPEVPHGVKVDIDKDGNVVGIS